MLEATLKNLFDYQRFERNVHLQDVIDETLERYARIQPMIVADDDLAMAAGGVGPSDENLRERDHDGRGKV